MKIYQEEFVNVETGEVLSASAAIHQFYGIEKHKALEDWRQVWKKTGDYSREEVQAPRFDYAVLNI